LADTLVQSITSGLGQRGITIVDRNTTSLLEAERDYQASGAVSDSDFVSLGNAAGVSAFILVSITGAGDMRRLQIRVVDVETGRVLYQSPQDDSMNI
jgi:TolB-like protein